MVLERPEASSLTHQSLSEQWMKQHFSLEECRRVWAGLGDWEGCLVPQQCVVSVGNVICGKLFLAFASKTDASIISFLKQFFNATECHSCGKRRHHNHWSFSCSPPRKKNNKLLAFCLYSRGLFLFNKWFGRAHSHDVQVQKYSSLASADHCAFRLSLMATCVSHKAHVNVLMVNLSDMFWRGEQWTFLIG